MPDTIRVFVGATEDQWLPTKVLEHSIRIHTSGPVEVMPLHESPIKIPATDKTPTPFSLQRFLPPELCHFEGRAIYLDSDMVVYTDIRELWEHDMGEARVCCCEGWQTAVTLYDCRVGWRISEIVAKLNSGEWQYNKLINYKYEPTAAHSLSKLWNVIDRPFRRNILNPDAKLRHFTWLPLQPWLSAKHPYEGLWFDALQAALDDGFISTDDVMREIELGRVRPSLASHIGLQPPFDDSAFTRPDTAKSSWRHFGPW
jgi:hypothetical protein